MSRLTFRDSKGGLWIKDAADIDEQGQICMLTERLAAYEDTGLEPSEIAHLRKQLHGYVKQCLHYEKQLKAYSSLGTVEELTELVKAKQDGRCVVLPCKVGDTVWYIPQYGGKPYCGAKEGHAQHITLSSRHWRIQVREHHPHNTDFVLGKTVFLTREEAEEAIKEAQHE